MAKQDGGPAFPEPFIYDADRGMAGDFVGAGEATGRSGMSLRDYFAGRVVGHLSVAPVDSLTRQMARGNEPAVIADAAYKIADAMLAAREA